MFKPHQGHCLVSLSKNFNPSLVLVQPRKTRPFITERLMMGCKKSNQTNKQTCEIVKETNVSGGWNRKSFPRKSVPRITKWPSGHKL